MKLQKIYYPQELIKIAKQIRKSKMNEDDILEKLEEVYDLCRNKYAV